MTTTIYRQEICLACGAELVHQATGRARRFCSAKCRVAYNRAIKQYARACVAADLAGKPEGERPGWPCYPVQIRRYEVQRDGRAEKRALAWPVTK